jgi:CubicO group peptidase (beta-lactamase class C family)
MTPTQTVMSRRGLAALAGSGLALAATGRAAGQTPRSEPPVRSAGGTDPALAARIRRFESGLRPDILRAGEARPAWTLEARMDHHKVPAVSIAVIRGGKLVWAGAYGVKDVESREGVDTRSVFSVGSVSKVVAAAVTLRLAARGQLDLDADVNGYLKSWKVPASPHTTGRSVTLRQILSHTSGLTVSGFPDYQPGEALPTPLQTLNGIKPSKTPAVTVSFTPGSAMLYSGGGVTVEQVLIADVAGRPFEAVADEIVLAPLGMSRSTFVNPLPERFGNIAKAHDAKGALVAKPRGYESFPEMAASGLWTTPSDLARLLTALMDSYRGSGDFLPRSLAAEMMSEVGPSIFGLGPRLSGEGPTRHFAHGGSNDSYKSWFEGHLDTGDGLVIFTNGAGGVELYTEIRSAIADALGWPFYRPVSEYRTAPGDPLLGALAGDYLLDPPASQASRRVIALAGVKTAKVTVDAQGQAAISFDKSAPMEMVRSGPLTFVGVGSYIGTPNLMRVEIVRAADGSVAGLIVSHDRYSLSATRAASQ